MKTGNPVSAYYISGVWLEGGQVTHYAVHRFTNPGVSGITKATKEDVIKVFESRGLPFYTWEWDYQMGYFQKGERIILHEVFNSKILWTVSRNDSRKNLKHLISYSWMGDE